MNLCEPAHLVVKVVKQAKSVMDKVLPFANRGQ